MWISFQVSLLAYINLHRSVAIFRTADIYINILVSGVVLTNARSVVSENFSQLKSFKIGTTDYRNVYTNKILARYEK